VKNRGTVYETKRENPLAVIGGMLGGLVIMLVVLALLTGWFMLLDTFLSGGTLGLTFLATVVTAIVLVTIRLRKWVNK